ncbi:DEBR0S1_01992g1_1 [Brettanomyces bruxellensis]|uniref:DEBR0S1_01992g1_1 n=1 Tax=Dekkera bruxellensis TaxID=5007 RepID=A0A7D9CXH2_DEKBR|nr:DEBR0S1_01992g1_1 [Brettanomyces bruxellensis]
MNGTDSISQNALSQGSGISIQNQYQMNMYGKHYKSEGLDNTANPNTTRAPANIKQERRDSNYLNDEVDSRRLKQEQDQLQMQVKKQLDMAKNKIQNQHRTGKQTQRHIPMLSREFVVRRISEGESGRLKEELKCEACGKGYKHITSLAKHLWEHTPEWQKTKNLSTSKHQHVQMLEAASILCSLTERKRLEHQKQVIQGNGSTLVPRGSVGQMQPLKQQAQSYLLLPAQLRQNYPAATVVNNGIYSRPNNYDYRGPYAESVMVHEPQNYLGTTRSAESSGSITSGTPRKASLSPEYASSDSKQDEQSGSSLSEAPNSKANRSQ